MSLSAKLLKVVDFVCLWMAGIKLLKFKFAVHSNNLTKDWDLIFNFCIKNKIISICKKWCLKSINISIKIINFK